MKILKNKEAMKYFKNTSWLLLEKILKIVVALFIGIWIARYLGPEQFGVFSYTQGFVGIFAVIATLGLDGIVIRELVKDNSQKNKLLGTAFILKFLASFFVLLLIMIAIQFTSNDRHENFLILIATSAVFFQAFNVVDLYFQAKVISRYTVYVNIIMLIISSIVKVYLILSGASLTLFVWVILFESIVLAAGYTYFYIYSQNKFKVSDLKFEYSTAITLLKDSWPLILSGIAYSLYMKVDQVMIKEMLDVDSVGKYAAAVRLSEAWYFIPLIITSSVFPYIIKAKKTSEIMYFNTIQKLFDFMVVLGVFISVVVLFSSDYLIVFLYGKEYKLASSVLVIHIWAGIFIGLTVVSGKWLIIENLTRHSMYRYGLGALLNIILNVCLISNMGIIGAAYSTLISYAFTGLFYDLLFKETRYLFYMKINALNLITGTTRLIKQ